jgi:23S rRNA (uracil1939-C5)-methyltransferase/tRNA (uracil-5-)-methyltransferase
VDISAQRAWKQAQVVDLLKRIGGVESVDVNPVVGTADAYGYRSKITPHYNPPYGKNKELKVGFQQRGTRIVIDIDRCLIATPRINEKYKETRATLATAVMPKGKGATLLFRDCEEGVETDPRKVVSQRVGDVMFRFKAGEFFQNNAFILPLLVEHVLAQAKGDGCIHLIDTYCGSGLFAITAATQFDSVYGVEVSDLAVRAAIANAELNKLKNVQFMTGVAEQIFSTVRHLNADQTVIIIDPPRKGCDDVFLNQLFQFRPKKLVYISCDPSTQARDTKAILAAGYTIKDCTPFDLFPQTRHIENVLTFVRL